MPDRRVRKDWEITPEKVERAIRKIVEVSRPLKLILSGSYVRGRADANSNLDVLVIRRDDVRDPREESVRIRRALRGISMPMDILLVPESKWLEVKDPSGMIYREALRTGKVVYQSEEKYKEAIF